MNDRPVQPETQVSCGPPRLIAEVAKYVPIEWLWALEHNQKLQACCRQIADHKIEYRKSREALPHPDIAIITCASGHRHIRMAAGVNLYVLPPNYVRPS